MEIYHIWCGGIDVIDPFLDQSSSSSAVRAERINLSPFTKDCRARTSYEIYDFLHPHKGIFNHIRLQHVVYHLYSSQSAEF
jgi:hypothetical protein